MTDTTPTPARVDVEQLAAYLDGGLSTNERTAVERALAESDELRRIFADAIRLKQSVEPPTRERWYHRLGPYGWAAVAAVLVVGALTVIVGSWRSSDLQSALTTMQATGLLGESGGTALVAVEPGTWMTTEWPVDRGANADQTDAARIAFRLGVRWADFILAWGKHDSSIVERAYAEMQALLRQTTAAAPASVALERAVTRARAGDEVSDAQNDIEAFEAIIQQLVDADRMWLGTWTEAARIALSVNQTSFMRSGPTHAALRRMAADSIWSEVVADISGILRRRDDSIPSDTVARRMAEIIRRGGS